MHICLVSLHIVQERWNDLLHVRWKPDVLAEVVPVSLPYNTLIAGKTG